MGITRNHSANHTHWKAEEVKLLGDRAVRFRDVCVHTFSVGDVEDPEIYAAGPIFTWEKSDSGKWIIANAVDKPYYIQCKDYNSWGHQYKIMARLSEQNETFWSLKWGGNK